MMGARLHTGKLKGIVTKSVVTILKDARLLGCVFQDTEPPESRSILRMSPKSWDQYDECHSQKLRSSVDTSEKRKVRRSE